MGENGGEDDKLRFWPQFKGTSLRQNTHFELLTMKIGPAVWSVRVPQKMETGKAQNYRVYRYISRMRTDAPVIGSGMVLNPFGDPPDVINWANFGVNRISRFGAIGGQILGFPL